MCYFSTLAIFVLEPANSLGLRSLTPRFLKMAKVILFDITLFPDTKRPLISVQLSYSALVQCEPQRLHLL